MSVKRKVFGLSDDAILGLVRSFQQALFTGTDMADHFRMIRLEETRESPGVLTLTPEWLEHERAAHEQLTEEAEVLSAVDTQSDIVDALDAGEVLVVNGQELRGAGDKHGPN